MTSSITRDLLYGSGFDESIVGLQSRLAVISFAGARQPKLKKLFAIIFDFRAIQLFVCSFFEWKRQQLQCVSFE
jgi:hypothetical protein